MEADIILEGFRLSEEIHGLRYLWLIGDGNSSVYHSVVTGVPSYGRDITKVECANHAVKCYKNRLEALCNNKPDYRGKHGLSQAMMKWIAHGTQCAIKMHSATGDVAALRYDLRNGSRHYFGLHSDYNSAFCQHKSNLSSGRVDYIIKLMLHTTEPSLLDKLPSNFLCDVEAAGDRLVAKAAQLIQTTNITENFMSIRCKMDGEKYYNRIQSGSFQHRSMAAALRVQFGLGWTTSILKSFDIRSTLCDDFTNSWKRKHEQDTARKISLKYKKQ